MFYLAILTVFIAFTWIYGDIVDEINERNKKIIKNIFDIKN